MQAIVPKIALDINICAPERRNVPVLSHILNRTKKTINININMFNSDLT